jgi:hypothetical protein
MEKRKTESNIKKKDTCLLNAICSVAFNSNVTLKKLGLIKSQKCQK